MGVTEDTIVYLEIVFGGLMPDYSIEVAGDLLDFTVMARKEGFMRSYNIDIAQLNEEYINLGVEALKLYIDRDIWEENNLVLGDSKWCNFDTHIDAKDSVVDGYVIVRKEDIPELIEWLQGVK